MLLAILGIGIIQNESIANATVGQQLVQPEAGWQRFDDRDPQIAYEGNWSANNGFTSNEYLNGNTHAIANPSTNSKILFGFYGSKIRLLSNVSAGRTGKFDIYIDNQFIGRYDQYNSTSKYFSVYFEKSDLNKAVHKVEVKNIEYNTTYNNSGYLFVFDAIDIDDTGHLVPYDEAISLDKSTMNLTQGDSGQLKATTTPAGAQVTWKSSDSSVATVDSTGKVTAAKEGTCTITATTADGLTATCIVTVTPKGTDPNPQPTDTEYITNIAHAKGDNTNNPSGEVTIIFHGTADTILSVVKTADVKDVWIGDNFTYTLVITNTGSKTAKAVVVNDPAPNHIDFNVSGVTTTQGTVDSSSTSKNIIVNVGDILPGGIVTIKIPSTVIA
jgi:uncharacterized repeat protein (TIGR01451 family)